MPEFVGEIWDEWWAQSLQFVTQPDPRVSAGLPASLSEGGRFSGGGFRPFQSGRVGVPFFEDGSPSDIVSSYLGG